MIIELLVNLRLGSGSFMNAGIYDSSKIEFPHSLWREIEIHKTRGRRTLRIIQDDPAPSPEKVTMIENEKTFTTTVNDSSEANDASTKTDETPKKKPRRKKKTT